MTEPSTPRAGTGIPIWPTSRLGWASIISVSIALILVVALPLITTAYGAQYPVTDSVAMPLIGTIALLIASVISVLALWPGRQFTASTIVAAAITVPLTLFIAPIVIGEGIA